MCTAVSVTVKDNYFGRNLDYEHSFGERIVITPRNYGFSFINGKKLDRHYALIGTAIECDNYPLYFDAINEKGLGIAGLNFPGNAKYMNRAKEKENIASFELIPRILSQCESVSEARSHLEKINITDEGFNENMSPTPLHWMVADREKAITVEQTEDGMKIFENHTGVLTNNPTFDIQMFNLYNYMSLTAEEPENCISDKISPGFYSKGMGARGIPGDLTSASRFVRAYFTKLNSVYGETEEEVVSQFFHILYCVYQQKGCVRGKSGMMSTHYTSCFNTDKGIYYYTTYYNSSINAVDMYNENLNGDQLIVYDMIKQGNIHFQNRCQNNTVFE